MSSVKLSGNASGTGIFTIASPNSNTDRTLNLPDASGTLLTNSGTEPGAFSTLSVNSNNISAVNSLGFRNRLINGDMRVDQRNAGAIVTPAAAAVTYTVDRWGFYNSTANNRFSFQQNAANVARPAGFPNYLGATVTSAYTPSGGDQQVLFQQIEGLNIADLNWVSASAQTVTLSFWVRSSLTGTHSGAIRNPNGYTRSYPFTFTINSANTWEYETIVIPGDTGGTWNTNTSAGIQVVLNLGSGSSSLGTAGSWNTSTAFTGATGSVQVSATNGATFYVTGVQLEAGNVATPYERIDYGRQLLQCQRYYQQTQSFYAGAGPSETNLAGSYAMFCPMRANPTSGGFTVGSSFHRPGIAFYAVISVDGLQDANGRGYSSLTIASGAGAYTQGQITGGLFLVAEL